MQITVVADYGGAERGLDPAFNEVHQHIRRFDEKDIVGLWKVEVSNVDSQFRSRDQYTKAMMGILNGDLSLLGQVLDPEEIPDVPKDRVGSVDKYENVKTTIPIDEIPDEKTGILLKNRLMIWMKY